MIEKRRGHDIDVVIPTCDRPEQLSVTLEALTRQSFTDFGVIVVDDGSRFQCEGLVPLALRAELRIRFVRNNRSRGAGRARNRGVAESLARYVVFIDDDCIAGPDLVRSHYEALTSSGEPTVSLGPISSIAGRRLPIWMHWDADHMEREYRKLGSGQAIPGWTHLYTGNVGLRRTDFWAVGGFDERFSRGEDVELGYRLDTHGCRFTYHPAAAVSHDSQRSLRSWMRIASNAALSDLEMQRRHPDSNRMAQLQNRHWAVRLMRSAFGGPIAGRFATAGAMSLGFLMHAVRADGLALPAFSVVHDLTYWRSLREACDRMVEPSIRLEKGAS